VKTQIRNRLTMTRGMVAARHDASSPDRYAWIWVLPLPDGRFRVALQEVPRHFVDNDKWFYDADVTTRYDKTVDSVEDVDAAVREAGGDPEDLDVPWRNDCPF